MFWRPHFELLRSGLTIFQQSYIPRSSLLVHLHCAYTAERYLWDPKLWKLLIPLIWPFHSAWLRIGGHYPTAHTTHNLTWAVPFQFLHQKVLADGTTPWTRTSFVPLQLCAWEQNRVRFDLLQLRLFSFIPILFSIFITELKRCLETADWLDSMWLFTCRANAIFQLCPSASTLRSGDTLTNDRLERWCYC